MAEQEKKLTDILNNLSKQENSQSLNEGFGSLSDMTNSGKLNEVAQKAQNISTVKFPLEAFFSQIIGQINSETADQSAKTMLALLELIQSPVMQDLIQKMIDVVIWLSEQTEKIAGVFQRLSDAAEDIPNQEGEVGEIVDPQKKPWWWPPFVPWVPAGGKDETGFVPPGDGVQ